MFTADPEPFQGRINSKFAREQFQPSTMVDSPSNQMKFEDIYPEEDNTAGGIFTGSTSSRARLFSQQRSMISKKRQNQLQNEGMIRRSGNNSTDDQYTPAVRQFSAPKTILSESTEFMKTNPMKVKSSSLSEEEKDFDDDTENRPNAIKKQAPTNKKPLYKLARPLSRARYMDDQVSETKTSHEVISFGENEEAAELGEGEASVIIDLYKEQKTPTKTPRSAQKKKRQQQRRRQQQEGEVTSQIPSADEGSTSNAPRSARKKDKSSKQRKAGHSRERKSADDSLNMSQEIISRPFVLDLSNMRQFLTSPIPKNAGVVQCYIRRNASGTNRLKPRYSLYLKDGDCFLMSSKKRSYNKTSNYLISMAENDLKRGSENYLGKLRSNFLGTEYQIFDDGMNPKDCESNNNNNHQDEVMGNMNKIRCELGAITYAATFTTSAPRKMQVALPAVDNESGKTMKWQDSHGPNGEGDDLLQRISKRLFRDCYYYINKPPRWNEQIGGYVLNFHGRVTMASVKNFQLVQPDEQGTVILQFGKVDKDSFNMDLQYPMSLFQAFAIALSSFDSKIACD